MYSPDRFTETEVETSAGLLWRAGPRCLVAMVLSIPTSGNSHCNVRRSNYQTYLVAIFSLFSMQYRLNICRNNCSVWEGSAGRVEEDGGEDWSMDFKGRNV